MKHSYSYILIIFAVLLIASGAALNLFFFEKGNALRTDSASSAPVISCSASDTNVTNKLDVSGLITQGSQTLSQIFQEEITPNRCVAGLAVTGISDGGALQCGAPTTSVLANLPVCAPNDLLTSDGSKFLCSFTFSGLNVTDFTSLTGYGTVTGNANIDWSVFDDMIVARAPGGWKIGGANLTVNCPADHPIRVSCGQGYSSGSDLRFAQIDASTPVGTNGCKGYTTEASDPTEVVAYCVADSGVPPKPGLAPSITSLSVTSGPVGTSVIITGSNFGSTQGTSTVTFNGTLATVITLWGTGSITATVPSGATTGPVVVTVGGLVSNSLTFTVTGVVVVGGQGPLYGMFARVTKNGEIDTTLQSQSWITGFTRFDKMWRDIQPISKSQFNWAPIDDFVKEATKNGKKAIIGVGNVADAMGKDETGTPDWVIALPGMQIMYTPGVTPKFPVWWNSVFQKEWDDFVIAFTNYYGGGPLGATSGPWGPDKIAALYVAGYSSSGEPNWLGSYSDATKYPDLIAQAKSFGYAEDAGGNPLPIAQGGVWAQSMRDITDMWVAHSKVPLVGAVHHSGNTAYEVEHRDYFDQVGVSWGNNGAGVSVAGSNVKLRARADKGLGGGWLGQAGKSLLTPKENDKVSGDGCSEGAITPPDSNAFRVGLMFQVLIGSDTPGATVATSCENVNMNPSSHISYISLNQDTINQNRTEAQKAANGLCNPVPGC